jgi:hypothetical protein
VQVEPDRIRLWRLMGAAQRYAAPADGSLRVLLLALPRLGCPSSANPHDPLGAVARWSVPGERLGRGGLLVSQGCLPTEPQRTDRLGVILLQCACLLCSFSLLIYPPTSVEGRPWLSRLRPIFLFSEILFCMRNSKSRLTTIQISQLPRRSRVFARPTQIFHSQVLAHTELSQPGLRSVTARS